MAALALKIVYDKRAEKQLFELNPQARWQITLDVKEKIQAYDISDPSRSFLSLGTVFGRAYFTLESPPYRVLARVQHRKQRVLIIDIDHDLVDLYRRSQIPKP